MSNTGKKVTKNENGRDTYAVLLQQRNDVCDPVINRE